MDVTRDPASDDVMEFLRQSWRLTQEECSYICVHATDVEFDAMAWCCDLTQRRMAIAAIERLLGELTERISGTSR